MPLKTTCLHTWHQQAKAHLAPFAGWEMPIHYGSQIEEHHQVRESAGVFDVSHMVAVDLAGRDSKALLQMLLANDVDKLQQDGRALYSCMLNPNGGVIDDLIVYRRATDLYRLVLNAGTAANDLEWITEHSKNFTAAIEKRTDLAILAIQGPTARQITAHLLGEIAGLLELPRFHCLEFEELFIGRTGYTGEDGFEVILPTANARQLWDELVAAGVAPVGLGARDTLRMEAGLCLYGQDLDPQHSPLESGLEWTIAWQPETRDFIGRNALTAQRSQANSLFTGILLEDRGVLRSGMSLLHNDSQVGVTTSGGFSPTLQRSIALARIDADVATDPASISLKVNIRGKQKAVRVVPLPFVKNGKIATAL